MELPKSFFADERQDGDSEFPWPVRDPAPAEQLALVDDRERRPFSDAERVQVWLKGVPGSGNLNVAYWRFDMDGNLMSWSDYEDADSPYAWEIDHIVPLSAGGTNALSNLRPLHVSRNRSLAGIFGDASNPHI